MMPSVTAEFRFATELSETKNIRKSTYHLTDGVEDYEGRMGKTSTLVDDAI